MSKRGSGKAAPGGKGPVGYHLAVDRFEAGRDGAGLAVLVSDDGQSLVVPRGILPADAEPGTTLVLTLSVDRDATAAVARETAAIRADLKKSDPGGTIRL